MREQGVSGVCLEMKVHMQEMECRGETLEGRASCPAKEKFAGVQCLPTFGDGQGGSLPFQGTWDSKELPPSLKPA